MNIDRVRVGVLIDWVRGVGQSVALVGGLESGIKGMIEGGCWYGRTMVRPYVLYPG